MNLKPCPFCGGPATLQVRSGVQGYTFGFVRVGCLACGFWLPLRNTEGKGHVDITDEVTKSVVEFWERRA